VYLAARLHDVGKMLIPSSILNKPDKLTSEERAVIEKHAEFGGKMLESIPGVPMEVIDGARFHHERYDGLGYNKLAGEDIPFMARIIAIADVFDALSEKRPYKPAKPVGSVLAMMTGDTPAPMIGRKAFDPVMLRVFV